jgi:hypothetical protein
LWERRGGGAKSWYTAPVYSDAASRSAAMDEGVWLAEASSGLICGGGSEMALSRGTPPHLTQMRLDAQRPWMREGGGSVRVAGSFMSGGEVASRAPPLPFRCG